MSSLNVPVQTEPPESAVSSEMSVRQRLLSDKQLILMMVSVAFLLRLTYIIVLQTYKMDQKFTAFLFPEGIPNFLFGFEAGSIARSIATGHGFSSPFGGDTGPSAWLAPVYPYFCAAIFKIFGVFSYTSGFVILSFNSLFAALTCPLIFKIAERCFSRAVAVWSGWLWAVSPVFMHWPTRWVWETALSAMLFSLIFFWSLHLSEQDEIKPWLGFGALWGFAALTNPSLLAFLPFSLAWPGCHLAKRSKRYVRSIVFALVTCVVVISPWMVRNQLVFHKTIFIRDNFPYEMRLGNFHDADGLSWMFIHPTRNFRQHAEYARLGELEFVDKGKQEVMEFIRQHPREFASLTLQRILDFWDGRWLQVNEPQTDRAFTYLMLSVLALLGLLLAIGSRMPGALLFACIIFYPAAYYVTYSDPRYRHAVEPELLILSVYFVYEFLENFKRRLENQQMIWSR